MRCSCFVALALSISALAGTVLPSARAITISDGTVPEGNNLDLYNAGSLNNPAFPANGAVQLTTTHTVAGGIFDASMFAQSNFAYLGVFASTALTSSATPGTIVEANGGASFGELLSINYAPLTGTVGFLQLGYTLDAIAAFTGTLGSSTGVLGLYAYTCSDFNLIGGAVCVDPNFVEQNASYQSSVHGSFVFPKYFKFVYGTPFDLAINMFATTDSGPGSSAVIDAAHSFALSGLKLYDVNGNPVNGPSFSSGSGTQYTQNGIVPEPGAVVLVSAGLAGFIISRLRRAAGHS